MAWFAFCKAHSGNCEEDGCEGLELGTGRSGRSPLWSVVLVRSDVGLIWGIGNGDRKEGASHSFSM